MFNDVPSCTNVLQHDIDVSSVAPIKQHAYCCPVGKREIMKREAEYLLENGLSRPSRSPWSSPCLLAVKSDGTPRFCTDFQKVNTVTIPDSFPLPRMEDCIDSIGPTMFVTKIDLLKGYWQVPVPECLSLMPSSFYRETPLSQNWMRRMHITWWGFERGMNGKLLSALH